MAIVIRGRSLCRLCGRTIQMDDAIVLFPPGIFGPSEPGFEVNDAGVHESCLDGWAHGAEAKQRLEEYTKKAES